MNKHNSDCKPDAGYYKTLNLNIFETNRYLKMLYYSNMRKLDKDLELIYWRLNECKKRRGLGCGKECKGCKFQ